MTEVIALWGKEILSVAIYTPIVWWLLKQQKQEREEFKTTIENGFRNISMAIWKYTVDDTDDIIDIAAKYIWNSNIEQIDFIKQRLEKNNLEEREDRIKKQLRTEMDRMSYGWYIKPLNKFTTKVGLLWDWIMDNYDRDEFMEEVYDVVFTNDSIDKKLNDIRTIMRSYQSEMFDTLKDLLNK